MKKGIYISFFIFLISSTLVNAETVQQGAQQYDWEMCLQTKAGDCLNGCANSEDINCNDTCDTLAKDKCSSEGLAP